MPPTPTLRDDLTRTFSDADAVNNRYSFLNWLSAPDDCKGALLIRDDKTTKMKKQIETMTTTHKGNITKRTNMYHTNNMTKRENPITDIPISQTI